MGYSIPRIVFEGRVLNLPPITVRSAAHIGEQISQSLANVTNDARLQGFEEIVLHFKATFAYTGGASDPTLTLRAQRKIIDDLDDSDDDAWEDFAATSIAATGETEMRLGALVAAAAAASAVAPVHAPVRDSLAAGECRFGHPGHKIRIREALAGGDRSGGTLSYDLRFLGIAVG